MRNTPAGTWTAQVARPRETTLSTLRFTAGGRALLVSGGVGGGTWHSTGPGTFTYRIAEPLFDSEGAYRGWVDIEQNAEQNGDSFTSAGSSRVHDAGDTLLYEARVGAVARRSG
uniref:Uncharacterized protein n=1 Tax=Streptomyces sp. NBC_01401 TaxID=2903854 RepID=A0AAU3GQA4_9ACTN